MFVHYIVRRRLASLLRPWMLEEPQLEVKLGLLNSQVTTTNLSFDVTAINNLIDHPSSFFFKEVTVDCLTVRFSNWSFPAFKIEVHGVKVALLAGTEDGEEAVNERRKKALARLDPQGTALHDLLEKLMDYNPSASGLTTSLLNLALNHCHFEIFNVVLEVQVPISNDTLSFSLELKKLNAESEFVENQCLFKGIISSMYKPLKESSLMVEFTSFRVGYKLNDQINCIVPPTDVFTCFKWNDLNLVHCMIRVPELDLLFSVSDLSVLLVVAELSSKKSRRVRNGKRLWKLAAAKLRFVISSPRLTFQNLVKCVCLWLCYLNAYQHLLSLLEYSEDDLFSRYVNKMSRNKMFVSLVKNIWGVIASAEAELPAEAIVQARRIARCRAGLKSNLVRDGNTESSVNIFTRILLVLSFIWSVMRKLLLSIGRGLYMIKSLFQQSEVAEHADIDLGNKHTQYLILNFGKIVVNFYPSVLTQNVNNKQYSDVGFSNSDIQSFCSSIYGLLIVYTDKVPRKSLSISCGGLNVKPSSLNATGLDRNSNSGFSSVKGQQKGIDNNSKDVLWSEPAVIILPSQAGEISIAGNPLLKKILGEMYLSWKKAFFYYDDNEIIYSETPWSLFEISNCLSYSESACPKNGLWKCSLAAGKLNIFLGIASMISMSKLLGQLNHTLKKTKVNARENDSSLLSSTIEDQKRITLEAIFELCVNRIKMALLDLFPERWVQLGIFVTGPHIQLSFGKIGVNGNNQIGITLGCHLHDIEVVVWPTSKFDGAAIEWPVDSEKIKQPQIIEIPRPKSDKVASQWWIALGMYLRAKGLNFYVEESGGQQSHICILKPIVFQSLIFRESVDLFGAAVTAFSASFSVIADGLTVVLNMDELYTFIQVVSGSSEAVLYAFASTHLISVVPLQDIMGKTLGTRESGDEHSMADIGDSINKSVLFSIRGTAKFKSVDIIIQSCKLNNKLENCLKGSKPYDAMIEKGLDRCDLTKCGIWFSVHQIYIEKVCEEEKLEVFFELSKIHCVILRCLYHERSLSIVTDLMLKPHNWLCEFSLINFSHSILFGQTQNVLNDMSSGSTLDASIAPPTSHWMLMNFTIGGVFMASCPVKDILSQMHQLDKLTSMLSVAGGPLMFDLRLQGIHLFLEPTAFTRFSQCFTSLLHSFRNLLSMIRSSCQKVANADTISVETRKTSHQLKWRLPEAFTMELSQCSFVLVDKEESGGFRKISVEVVFHVKFQMTSMLRKFVVDLSHLSVFSQVLKEHGEINTEDPHSSVMANEVSLGHSAFASQHANKSHLGSQNHIIYRLAAFIAAEQPMNASGTLNQVWVGSGSISGFDVSVSLSEMQMIIHVVSSFSVPFTEDMDSDQKHVHWSNDQESYSSMEKFLPDGAIVALQDVDQHMYFSVEGEEKYSLVGVVHYSLCGERALFRVKHQQQRFWRSSTKVFSLISLYAKNNSGESLRLNCHPRSSIVDIASTVDDKWSLWSALPCEHEYYKGDIDWEPCNKLVKDNFYLINQKNDCGVAFVDGIPEFVRKPGNLFKFKVFLGISVPHSLTTSDGCPIETGGARQHRIAPDCDGQTSEQCGSVPFLQIKVDNISLTITHELLDSRNRVPLLRSCIDNTILNIQILPLKTRVMSTSTASVYYFDAQRTFWREFLKPVAIFTFYRSNLQNQGTRTVSHGVPVHLHCRTEKLDTYLTEVSLDILLFMIGKLNLAGPFSVKSSVILANCCKVDNQTGLNLLCTFDEKETVMIPSEQSTSIVLRNPVNHPSRQASTVTIQLTDTKSFATSSLQCSLSKTQTCAWRTRIMSLQGSSTHPGPFVVIDISRNAEEGLSITVSPLTAIHNETEFPLELRLQRLQQDEAVSACVSLKKGETLDDSKAAFDAISLSGGLKKALISLSLGNFMFSFRPEIADDMINPKEEFVVEWSDDFKGGKAIGLSGILDKLGYKVRRALSVDSNNCSFSTTSCSLKSGDTHISKLHFLIETVRREVPIRQPEKPSDDSATKNPTVAMQEQKGVFLLPTVRVSNLLHTEIHVLLSETGRCTTVSSDTIGKQATISCGSNAVFYANPSIIYFMITLAACGSRCKPVNSGDWIKKLQKSKSNFRCLDIPVEFGAGQYFAALRLSQGIRGIIEAVIYTSYSLRNDTGFSLFSYAPHQKPLSRGEVQKYGSKVPPELGLYSPPKSVESWLSKSHKMRLKLLDDHSSEASLDLDALSGFTEISLEVQNRVGAEHIIKFGVSMSSSLSEVAVPSQIITLVPRHVIFNESDESVAVRQCYLEDESAHVVDINAKQRMALQLQKMTKNHREMSLFENFIRKHKNEIDSSQIHIQFRLNGSESSWSGPVCIASLGRFFIKFKKQASQVEEINRSIIEFAAVHVAEEGSSLVVHYHKPPNISLPYRIENNLCDASLTFYQKDSSEQEVLGPGCGTYYVWDDLTLPHKLVVVVDGKHLLREINLDKVRPWKPFTKVSQHRKLAAHPVMDERSRHQNTSFGRLNSMELVKLGYEIYADGLTRVLRICEFSDCHKRDRLLSLAKVQIRFSHFAIHLLELGEQDVDENDCRAIIAARFGKICLDSISTGQQKYNNMSIQSLNVDQRQTGAPFAAVLRRHESDLNESNAATLRIVFVLLSTSSFVRQAKYTSIILQPIDLNLDEETLMKIASFWRTNLSDSTSPSQQYYFDHFEVHPIKIVANFVPGDSISYNSTQEALRSLLHSVVKIPHIKNMIVELNGVLVTHALITIRELFIRCAQHYSWYAMRAIYIAKGSSLLPPAFASIFDDLASSSLDVFFDPSRQMFNLPGLTLGTFKFITKCIDSKGFSGTKRYFGDLEKTLRTIGSNMLFAAVTEISDSILRGAETSGFDGLVSGFHHGILNLAMEPSVLGTALMGGGPDRRIKLDQSPGVEELYIEGYLQAMLDSTYKQEYLRVRVIDDQVILKNLPPNSALIDEILNRVKGFLVNKGLLKGDPSNSSRASHYLGRGSEWKLGPTVMTLCEHLFVSFVIRTLRKQTSKLVANFKLKEEETGNEKALVAVGDSGHEENHWFRWRWGIGKFVLSGLLAYIDGRLCRCIPNPLARRIVSGYLLSFLDKNDSTPP